MEYIAPGLHMRERVTLANMLRVTRLVELMQSAETWQAYGSYLDKIIQELAEGELFPVASKREVGKREQLARQVLEKTGMLNKSHPKENAAEDLKKILAWFAVQIGGKTPYEVAETMTSDESAYLAYEILKNKHEQLTRLLMAQHAPKEANKALKSLDRSIKKSKPGALKRESEGFAPMLSMLQQAHTAGRK